MSDRHHPLRVCMKARRAGGNVIYNARDVYVYCGDNLVQGVSSIKIDMTPGEAAVITLRVYAVVEAIDDDIPIP